MTRQDTIISLRLNVGILAIILIVAVCLIAVFVAMPAQREMIKFIAAVIGGGAAVYAAFYTGNSLKYNRHRQRQDSAYKILDTLNDFDNARVRSVILEATKEKLLSTVLYAKITGDVALRKDVIRLLGVFEDLSIAIQSDYADEEVLFNSLGGMVPFYFESLRGYIEELRKVTDDERYYCELERLSNAWKSSRSVIDQHVMKESFGR